MWADRRGSARRRAVVGVCLTAWLVVGIVVPSAGAAAGDLDPTFSADGRVVGDFGSDDRAAGVAVQPDGRIVVAGTSCGGDFLVARYEANGNLDGSFGTGGRVCVDVASGSLDEGEQVLVLGDGRLVVAGTSGSDFALVRLNANGSPDVTFGTAGKATYDLGGTDRLNDAALAPDGKVVMVGETTRPGCPLAPVMQGQTTAAAVARVTADGALDPTFGTGGRAVRGSESEVRRGFAVAVQSDGAVVVAGRVASCSRVSINFAVFRLTAAGMDDAGFAPAPVSGDLIPSSAVDVVVQPDGKVVVAVDTFVGPATSPQRDDAFSVVRYNPDGSVDASFDGDGVAVALFGEGADAGVTSVALQGDKIVLGGTVNGDFALARFNADGSPDTTFDGDGRVVTDFGATDALAALAVQPDGRLVAAGRSGSDVAVARYGTASTSTSTSTTTTSTTTTSSTTTVAPSTTTTTVAAQHLVCAVLRQIRTVFAGSALLAPFTPIIDAVGAVFGCRLS